MGTGFRPWVAKQAGKPGYWLVIALLSVANAIWSWVNIATESGEAGGRVAIAVFWTVAALANVAGWLVRRKLARASRR